jgi:hypothetical protein
MIETGAVSVRSHGSGGQVPQLANLGPGEYFGEIGLINRVPRTATVTASAPSRLLRIGNGLPGRAVVGDGRALVAGGSASPSGPHGAYQGAPPEVPGTPRPAPA